MDSNQGKAVHGPPSELAEQLVVEILVRDLGRAVTFYSSFGFVVERREPDFAVLRWGDRRLFLDERHDLPAPGPRTMVNVRVVVADVDRYWALAQSFGAAVEQPIGDREYGLRDFTVRDPDGCGVRFASVLSSRPEAPAT